MATGPAVEDATDIRAIVDLTIAYTWALDTRSYDDLHRVFTADAVADLRGSIHEGIESILERVTGGTSRFDVTQHLVGNQQVHLDGDSATCRTQLQAQHVKLGTPGGDTFIVGGIYHDEMVRTADGWRIRHRRLEQTWSSGNPVVLQR